MQRANDGVSGAPDRAKSRAAPTAPDLAWPVAIGTGICFGFRRALKAGRMSPVAVRKTRRPGARRAAARRDTVKPAPRVGLVSLGCPKALVDCERIITKLRAEGYAALAPTTPAPTWWWSTPAASSNSAKQESLDAIGEAMAKNGRVVVTGCFGVEKERILRRASRRAGRHRARTSTSRWWRPCTRPCRRCTIPSSISCRRRACT